MKIKYIYVLIALFYMCCACSPFGYKEPEYVKIADKITDEVAKKLKLEKELYLVGTGGGMMNHIRMMAMGFDFYEEIDLKTARELTVYTINEYLSAINSNESIRPYLCEYPFTAENIEIRIWPRKPNGENPKPGNICSISATQGMIRYDNKPSNDLLETMHEETFAEAQRIVLLENHREEAE